MFSTKNNYTPLRHYKLLIDFEETSLEYGELIDITDYGMKIDMFSIASIPIDCKVNATLYNLADKAKPKKFPVQGRVIGIKQDTRDHKTRIEIFFHERTILPDDIIAYKLSQDF